MKDATGGQVCQGTLGCRVSGYKGLQSFPEAAKGLRTPAGVSKCGLTLITPCEGLGRHEETGR